MFWGHHLDVEPKIGGFDPPKWMDGLFHGKPYEQMDDWGGFSHYFWFNTHFSTGESLVVQNQGPRALRKPWNSPLFDATADCKAVTKWVVGPLQMAL